MRLFMSPKTRNREGGSGVPARLCRQWDQDPRQSRPRVAVRARNDAGGGEGFSPSLRSYVGGFPLSHQCGVTFNPLGRTLHEVR